jgi:diguanylate cyclase (GGDEF)-like protein/PAS domain S-box-containing protein
MTGKRRRFGLVAQSLLGFTAGALLVALLIFAGDRMLQDSIARLQATLDQQILPLADLQRLQSRLSYLRVDELDLLAVRDIFQLPTQSARMRGDLRVVDGAITEFADRLSLSAPAESMRLRGHWQEYRSLLESKLGHADTMDLLAIERESSTASFLPYAAIESLLAEIAVAKRTAAEQAYQQTVEEQASQRRVFMSLVLVGTLLLISVLAWSARAIIRRIGILNESAQRLATGGEGWRADVGGNDEISDLADAFNRMRDEVLARELALQQAHDELESRVIERTRELRDSNERLTLLSEVAEQNPVGILIADREGRIDYVNPAYIELTGQQPSRLLGQSIGTILNAEHMRSAAAAMPAVLAGGPEWQDEQVSYREDGSEYWERLRVVAVRDDNGNTSHLLMIREDISERREQEERIAYQAHYDALTTLPNRVLALDRLVQVSGQARRDGDRAAVMFLDLDNFKEINDTLGHEAGDELLRQAAVRLRGTVREADTVARLGGDEFLVILAGLGRGKDAAAVADKVIEAFATPFPVAGRDLIISPSIGLAIFPEDGDEPAVLLRNADLAMYEAKEAGRNTYRFFNQAIHDLSLRRLEIGHRLRSAMTRGELQLLFQPLIHAQSGRLIGAEALLRWHNDQLGTVPPETFIPVAEQGGLIVEIGAWVLREACTRAAQWRARQADFLMAVNVSPRQFREPDFADQVAAVLGEFDLPPAALEIEVTEGLLLHNQDDVRAVLDALRALGIRLSMDDFGTGYSSLSYLRAFPFTTLKIDRGFVHDVSDDAGDRDLVIAAVSMAKALGLRVIAEGVETDAQWMFLNGIDCDVVQGYRFGRPVCASDFEATWLSGIRQPGLAS